jgi:hypothetical protein
MKKLNAIADEILSHRKRTQARFDKETKIEDDKYEAYQLANENRAEGGAPPSIDEAMKGIPQDWDEQHKEMPSEAAADDGFEVQEGPRSSFIENGNQPFLQQRVAPFPNRGGRIDPYATYAAPRQEWIPDRRTAIDDANTIFKMLQEDQSKGRIFGSKGTGGGIDNTPFAKPLTPKGCTNAVCKNLHRKVKWPIAYDPTSVESGGHEELQKIHNGINWLLEEKITPTSSTNQKDLDQSRGLTDAAAAQHQRFYDWHSNMEGEDLIPAKIKQGQGLIQLE